MRCLRFSPTKLVFRHLRSSDAAERSHVSGLPWVLGSHPLLLRSQGLGCDGLCPGLKQGTVTQGQSWLLVPVFAQPHGWEHPGAGRSQLVSSVPLHNQGTARSLVTAMPQQRARAGRLWTAAKAADGHDEQAGEHRAAAPVPVQELSVWAYPSALEQSLSSSPGRVSGAVPASWQGSMEDALTFPWLPGLVQRPVVVGLGWHGAGFEHKDTLATSSAPVVRQNC